MQLMVTEHNTQQLRTITLRRTLVNYDTERTFIYRATSMQE